MTELDKRHRSSIYDSMVKSPNRAMLRATGMTDKDFETPIVGVISTWAENTPCNIHLHDFGKLAKEGVKSAGAWPVQFGTITVADGIAMGTPGMRFSLTSRDIIADSIEAAMGGHNVDAFVAIGGCDKNMPGSMIAIKISRCNGSTIGENCWNIHISNGNHRTRHVLVTATDSDEGIHIVTTHSRLNGVRDDITRC